MTGHAFNRLSEQEAEQLHKHMKDVRLHTADKGIVQFRAVAAYVEYNGPDSHGAQPLRAYVTDGGRIAVYDGKNLQVFGTHSDLKAHNGDERWTGMVDAVAVKLNQPPAHVTLLDI